jgi:hypothetical protein
MTAHSRWLDIIYTIGVMFRCPLYPLSLSSGVHRNMPLSVVKSLLLSLSYHGWKEVNVSCCTVFLCASILALERIHQPLACSGTSLWMKSRFQFWPWPMGVGLARRPSDWAGKYSLVSETMSVFPLALLTIQPRRNVLPALALTCSRPKSRW